ncbi:MAG: 50S ribosomal protein L18 [Candidatus Woykebacteria bacterium]
MENLSGRSLRQKRVRAKIKGDQERPRLNVFRSNKHIYGALVNDRVGKTLLSATDREIGEKGKTKTELAFNLGVLIGSKAVAKKIKSVVFDRAGYRYHGRVKAFAEGARKGGLKF